MWSPWTNQRPRSHNRHQQSARNLLVSCKNRPQYNNIIPEHRRVTEAIFPISSDAPDSGNPVPTIQYVILMGFRFYRTPGPFYVGSGSSRMKYGARNWKLRTGAGRGPGMVKQRDGAPSITSHFSQSEAGVLITWSLSANQRPSNRSLEIPEILVGKWEESPIGKIAEFSPSTRESQSPVSTWIKSRIMRGREETSQTAPGPEYLDETDLSHFRGYRNTLSQSEPSVRVMWSLSANKRPVCFRNTKMSEADKQLVTS